MTPPPCAWCGSRWLRLVITSKNNTGHILNLGHGVMPSPPEDKVAMFFEATRTVNDRL